MNGPRCAETQQISELDPVGVVSASRPSDVFGQFQTHAERKKLGTDCQVV